MGRGGRWTALLWACVCGAAWGATDDVLPPRWVGLTQATPAPPLVNVVTEVSGDIVVRIQIPGYWAFVDSRGMRAALDGCVDTCDPGQPQVPRVVTSLRIAESGSVTVDVLARDGVERAAPGYVRAVLERRTPVAGDAARLVSEVSPAVGEGGDWYPAAPAALSDPFLFRTWRGVTLHTFPFQYDTLRERLFVASNLLVRVRMAASPGLNPLNVAPAAGHAVPEFTAMARHLFANGEPRSLRYTHVPEAGRLLIITADAFLGALQPLMAWKRQKGIPTDLVPVSSIGNTYTNIQAFVLNTYLSNGLAYVCLVGDADQLAYPLGTKGIMNNAVTPADPRYGLLAGADSYPEVIVSRMPGRTVADISNMVSRIIRYERDAGTNETWRARGCGIGAAQDLASDGFYDYQRIERIRTQLTNFTYVSVDQIYDPGANLAVLTNALNAGRGLVNYQGHGNASTLSTPSVPRVFVVADVLALRNVAQLPCVYITGCRAGQFHSGSDCLAEAWVKAGTAAAPRGAIAVFASSHDQYLLPPTVAQQESTDLLVGGDFQTVGALWGNGMMKAVSAFPHINPAAPGTVGEELYEQTHIFGDGSLTLYTATPRPLLVQHAGVRYTGQAQYGVRVPGLVGALCALYAADAGVLIGTAYSEADGRATIPLPANLGSESLTLTVTAFNRVASITPVTHREAWAPGMHLKVW